MGLFAPDAEPLGRIETGFPIAARCSSPPTTAC
jgi:hypothetical protein